MSLIAVKKVLFLDDPRRRAETYEVREVRTKTAGPTSKAGGEQQYSLRYVESNSTLDMESQASGNNGETIPKRWRFRPSPRMISDAVIGLSDGLTVPFALTAGLSSLGDTHIVVLGGLAELIAGAISMGLGGFIAAKSEAESYQATLASTEMLIRTLPVQTTSHVHSVLQRYSHHPIAIDMISQDLHQSPVDLLDFLMRFHHQMQEPDTSRPWVSAATIAAGYFLGGFVPLLPYFFVRRNEVLIALWWSIGIMTAALFAFGWAKTGIVSGWKGRERIFGGSKSGVQMVVVGGVAAGAAVALARAINHGK